MNTFDNSQFEAYKTEAKEKWGAADVCREYEKRSKDYTENNWQSVTDGMNDIFTQFARCKAQDEGEDSAAVQALAEKLQSFITENFYTCTKQILAGLGQMYVADPRFKANIDQNAPGTAEFVSRAIAIYCGK